MLGQIGRPSPRNRRDRLSWAAALALAALLAGASASAQDMGWISWLNPDRQAARVPVVDPETGDTIWTASCTQDGGTLSDLSLVRVYRWPAELVATVDVRGREGVRDSVLVARGAHYWAQAADTNGNRSPCPPMTYLPRLDPTGVPADPTPATDPVLTCRLYDVRGRTVAYFAGWVWDELERRHGTLNRDLLLRGVTNGRLAAGVYFLRGTTRDRRVLARRVVLVR